MKQKKLTVLVTAIFVSLLLLGGSLTALAAQRLEKVNGLWWDDKTACWDEVENAARYEVTLYRNGSSVASIKASRTKYNFSAKFTKEGEYTFRVRAVGKGTEYIEGMWSDRSDGYSLDEAGAKAQAAAINISETKPSNSKGPGAQSNSPDSNHNVSSWVQNATGWWYREADGSYPANTWKLIQEKWYCFDGNGYMRTGWINWNREWYYCGSDGAMWINTTTPDGYNVDENGMIK